MSERPSTAEVLGSLVGRIALLALCGIGYVLILRWLASDAPAWAQVIAVYIALLHVDLLLRLGDMERRLK